MEPDQSPPPEPVSNQPIPSGDPPATADPEATGSSVAAAPAPSPLVATPAADEEAVTRDWLWVAFLLGVALLLALCAVLALVASGRAPVGAPG
jgi:hypothetical protein